MHRPDPHLLAVIQQQGRLIATSPSGVAAQQAQDERVARWAGIAPGMACHLTPEALRQAQGRGDRLHLPPDTPCRIMRVDPERGCALVLVELPPPPHGGPATIANEYGREEIILPEDFPEEPPPAPRNPPPVDRERLRAISTRGRGRNRLPGLW
jgi:hypothetical protein